MSQSKIEMEKKLEAEEVDMQQIQERCKSMQQLLRKQGVKIKAKEHFTDAIRSGLLSTQVAEQ